MFFDAIVADMFCECSSQGLNADFEFYLLDVDPSRAGAGDLPFEVVTTSTMEEAEILLTEELDYEDVDQRFFRFLVYIHT